MIRFLFIGLLRDRHRSQLPVIVVALGVMLTVLFHCWITGILGDSVEFNARFSTGHVKITTVAYADNMSQMPNDLALTGADTLLNQLRYEFPDMDWVERIHLAGLLDVPDSRGETYVQGPVVGFGIDLLSGKKNELNRMNIPASLKKGRLPEKEGEILVSDDFATKLKLDPGEKVSLIGSTMYGEMEVTNFILSGTVAFGTTQLDRGSFIADIGDIRKALNMENATGEILGYFATGYYNDEEAGKMVELFNRKHRVANDEFSPVMNSLKSQNSMRIFVEYASKMLAVIIFVFILAMSIVLWNAGLLGGLRRYSEYGMRLAVGEDKMHVYKTMIYESLLIGITGSVVGIAVGLAFAWYLQTYGIELNIMKNATLMMPGTFRARITPPAYYIGFIPGVLSTLAGTMLSGIGIFKRQTAQLFKELET